MKNENILKFETSDFYLSAFLIAKSLKLLDVNKANPQRALFVFEENEDRRKLTEDFMFGRAQIEPKSFISAIKELKQILYSSEINA